MRVNAKHMRRLEKLAAIIGSDAFSDRTRLSFGNLWRGDVLAIAWAVKKLREREAREPRR